MISPLLLALAVTQASGPPPAVEPVTVQSPGVLPSVGLMNDHMHEAGQFMIGLRVQHEGWSGSYRSGTRSVSDEALMDAGYMMRARSMSMDMAMLDLMYGASDRLTVTLSPQFVWNRMKMADLGAMGGSMPMDVETETTRGFGDTLASASFRLARSEGFNAHVTLGVWLPTGRSGLKADDGLFTQYCMQPGGGVWAVEPSATITGRQGAIGWGAQVSYRTSLEDHNSWGWRPGERAFATGWVSYLLSPAFGVTARAEYTHRGRIHGQYDGPHGEDMPEDFPANFGGDLLLGAIGLNWRANARGMQGTQVGIEAGVPLYQRAQGVQLPQQWRLSAAVRQFF